MPWRDGITIQTVDDRPEFNVVDAFPLVMDRLEAANPGFVERILRMNGGQLRVTLSEDPGSISAYDPSLRQAWIFAGTTTGFDGGSWGGNTAEDGSCIPITVEEVIIHEMAHASDPWAQVQAALSPEEGAAMLQAYLQIALHVQQQGGWTEEAQNALAAFSTQYDVARFGFTPEFLQADALDRLRAVAEVAGIPVAHLTSNQMSILFNQQTGVLEDSLENWAMNTTERYLQQLFPLTAERDLGDYFNMCSFEPEALGADAQRLPFSHIMAERRFYQNVGLAVQGISQLVDGFQVQDAAALVAPASYFAEVAAGRHRAPHGLPE